MAYSATVSKDSDVTDGRKIHKISIVEDEAAAASEFSIPGVPEAGRIVSYRATLISGSGATINPIIGLAASFAASSQNHLATNSTTAAHVNDQTELVYFSSSSSLHIRSTVNAGSDNVVHTEIVILEGCQS